MSVRPGHTYFHPGHNADDGRRELFALLALENAYRDLADIPLRAGHQLEWQRRKVGMCRRKAAYALRRVET
jgi:hypothetical protein